MMGTFGVVLSGGGVLCAAEIGMLQALRDWGIHPEVVVGCSGGGIIAGALGAGVPLDALAATLRVVCAHPDRYGLGVLRAAEDVLRKDATPGLWTLRPALEDVLLHAKEATVDGWAPGYGVVATDLGNGSPVMFWGGGPRGRTTMNVLQATSAFPGLFEGVREFDDGTKDYLLADGGLLNNTPGDLAVLLGAGRLLVMDFDGASPLPATLSPLDVLYRSVQAAIRAAQRPEPKVPTLRINPTLPSGAWLLGYDLYPQLVEAGYAAAVAQRGEIEALARGAVP